MSGRQRGGWGWDMPGGQWSRERRNEDRGWEEGPCRVPTCHQVPDEEGLIFLVVLQHALEVLLFPLDGDLPVELMALLLTLSQCLGS